MLNKKSSVAKWVGLFGLWLCLATPWRSGAAEVAASARDAFRAQSWHCWHRDVQDAIEAAGGNSTQLVAVARSVLSTPAPFGGGELLDFRRVAPGMVPWLLEELSHPFDARAFYSLILALGQIGPDAKDAISQLRKNLEIKQQSESIKIPLRIALVNLGYRPLDLMQSISIDLMSQELVNQETAQNIVLRSMAIVGARDWLDNSMARRIASLTGAGGSTPFFAILALGAAGTNAVAALPALEELEQRARVGKADSNLRRVIGLARYRIDPAHPKAVLRANVSYLGARSEATDGLVTMWIVYTLVDDAMTQAIVELLADSEDRVRYGAASLLAFVGRPAEKAAPRLLELVRESQLPQVKMLAAFALGPVAGANQIAELRTLLAQAPDAELKKVLGNSLRMIQHELLEK
jgi:hypothetical protein